MPAVLNVDDSEDDIVMLHAACQSAKVSFRLHAVDGAENALLYLTGAEPYSDRACFPLPDLLLLDLKMPGKTGFDLLEWLRAQPDLGLRQLPAIVFTSSMHEEDLARAFALGADAYVVKPSDFDDMRQLVRSVDSVLSCNPIELANIGTFRHARLRK